ncbi:MAG: precorrin-6y C5,15-methyltransferase (decarboxylating) subunit CbiE [Prevotella sp.]|nr:precorrin-6y C5,15-methyltransferase (decarboxylating) subunit CbiE [Prevotella sp.]
MKFTVIGITDSPKQFLPPEAMAAIGRGKIFSGGRRHHDLVSDMLPAGSRWIDITVPLDRVFEQYRALGSEAEIVVFASGDPLFFGFANTIRERMPEAAMQVFPAFNSLQMLAHRLLMPYHDLRVVSLTGRPWPAFDRALIERTAKIGVLTDREHTPAAIARRMLDYGYADYQMHVGEHLGNPDKERITTLTLDEATNRDFANPNCLILTIEAPSGAVGGASAPFGLPDNSFALLDGRERMITKMPIRLLTLQALDLAHRHVLWDIGFCTGSVSIEARRLFPHLQIESFEIRPECEAIMRENMRRHGAPGIGIHMGDFCSVCCDTIATNTTAQPDAVFIGGHGGRLKDIMATVLPHLRPGGVIVMNSVKAPRVTTDSRQLWDEACRELGLEQDKPMHIQLDDQHPITILKCRK